MSASPLPPPDREATPQPPDPVRQRHTYAFPEGTMYATVWPAIRHADYVYARIEVTSGAVPRQFLKIRGRGYGAAELFRCSRAVGPGGGVTYRWEPDFANYQGGYCNQHGRPLDYRSSIWERLRDIVEKTLDRVTTDVPDWKQESRQLLLLQEWTFAQEAVVDLEERLRGAQAEERRRITAFGDSLAARTLVPRDGDVTEATG